MKWTPDLSTGIEILDHQHRQLIQATNDYVTAFEAGQGESIYPDFLDFLTRYAQAHFALEEKCMMRFRCPVTSLNAAAHVSFSAMLVEFAGRQRLFGYRADDANELTTMVLSWLDCHIAGIDAQLRDVVPPDQQTTDTSAMSVGR